MIYDFSKIKHQYESLNEELQSLKKEYQKPQMSKEQLEELKQTISDTKKTSKKASPRATALKYFALATAFIGVFILLPNASSSIAYAMEKIPIIGSLVEVVTFRDYKYETDRNKADVVVPEIVLCTQTPNEENEESHENQEKLEQTINETNIEIQEITNELIAHFESQLKYEEGYQDIIIKSEILVSTEDYFTLQLFCYQGSGSGTQWNYFYTIDLNTGERLQLKDIFVEGADYITPINESIKEQMQAQMDADEYVYYWLNDEIEEWNFKTITDKTDFYLNKEGNVVIGFDEGEVAPMYMGSVEFEIPADVLNSIRK